MKVYLEHRGHTKGVENNKFYELEIRHSKLYIRWGRTTRYPKVKNKYALLPGMKIVVGDKPTLIQQYQRLLNQKLKRGYVIIKRNNSIIESRPAENGRQFGIEIETNTNLKKRTLKSLLVRRKLRVKIKNCYDQSDGKVWDIKDDSSCGYEIASPILHGEAGIFDVKLAVDKIKYAIGKSHMPDHECGIHVTVDVSDFKWNHIHSLIVLYLMCEKYFYKKCNEHRQSNEYCRKFSATKQTIKKCMRSKTLTALKKILQYGRYFGLNLTGIRKRGVVEFRMFQSELNPLKVTSWIRMCIGFIDYVKSNPTSVSLMTISSKKFWDMIHSTQNENHLS